ncbi:carboxypeptidase-like regulatory domain-containing protein [Flavobacterium chilense]|uniref:CarboxypepD_reg-like domain-containing protein n=1 Tax=Flavobacterium chilense TaxID=946677 RepID=A0A1M7J9C3_9FLAO|nr:carboxypeptidase-like regulatory domain-containing protein [Flavobacterium chilense]SHM49584.1 hypothetical protein SAMN05444484_106231 [Flavobacterium chilense]
MKKSKSTLLIIICISIMSSCSSFRRKLGTNNKGRYIVTVGKNRSKGENETFNFRGQVFDVVTIRGHVFDLKTRKPLRYAVATAGCFKFITTDNGEYSFKTRNIEGKSFQMDLAAMYYHTIETDFIDIYNKKEIIIDFYLAEDSRSFPDCVQGETHEQMQKELNNLK